MERRTAAAVDRDSEDALIAMYTQLVRHAAVMAFSDRKPAKMGWEVGTAPNIAFVRCFRMKNGSVRTDPGFLCRRVEKALDNVLCIFFNGAQGDVNPVDVNAKNGDFYDMFMDFDDVSSGYFPMQDAYDEGGYEVRSSQFKAGVAELIIKEGITLLDELSGQN